MSCRHKQVQGHHITSRYIHMRRKTVVSDEHLVWMLQLHTKSPIALLDQAQQHRVSSKATWFSKNRPFSPQIVQMLHVVWVNNSQRPSKWIHKRVIWILWIYGFDPFRDGLNHQGVL